MPCQLVETFQYDFTLINSKMKYLLSPVCLLLFIYVTTIPNVAGNGLKNILNFGGYTKNLRRTLNTTSTLKSAKFGNFLLKDNITNRHTSLREERFETRVNHFSTDDLRTVEFVRTNSHTIRKLANISHNRNMFLRMTTSIQIMDQYSFSSMMVVYSLHNCWRPD